MSADEGLWAHHHAEWRDPAQVIAQWDTLGAVDPGLVRARASAGWWEALERTGETLLISREYEHAVIGLSVRDGKPHTTYLRLPHPSGIAVDRERSRVYIASTRNPNQVYTFAPVSGPLGGSHERVLIPVASSFYPGSLYIHDLALVGGKLHANAVGQNAVARLDSDGQWRRVWWPQSIERGGEPDFSRNYLQLNSIASGRDLPSSFFSASAATMSNRRPGHLNFPVDRRGVVFSGKTREPMAAGLTRPHSARLHAGQVWVDNSGYGEVGFVAEGGFEPAFRLPGWTRGLCFVAGVAFVGTSRVIPRFRHYAPGIDLAKSICAVHAIDVARGKLLGRIEWPAGNQVFAVESMPRELAGGLPFSLGAGSRATRMLFYGFQIETTEGSRG